MFHKESIDTPGNARVVQRRTPGCLLPFSLHHGRGGGLSPLTDGETKAHPAGLNSM